MPFATITEVHRNLRRTAKVQLTLLVLLLSLAACGESTRESSEPGSAADSGKSISPSDTSGGSASSTEPAANGVEESFEQKVFKDFAGRAIDLPKSVRDSIVKLRDPKKIMEASQQVTRLKEAGAKADVASKYGITVDSLESIIRNGNSVGK